MRALVTGGAGFIGSHLAEELCRRGAKVFVLDNLSYGSADNLSWKRAGDDLEFVQGSVADRNLVRQLVRDCDCVFHQAAVASVPYSVAEPEQTNAENLDATLFLLAESRRAGVKRFVFASSCSVYGDLARPAIESDPINPLSPYALQKYAAERYAQMFAQFHGLATVVLRYFNVFGPRQSFSSPYSGVIARFCTAALEGQQPVVFGDGRQTRDFVYVSNVVEANLLAAETEKASGHVFNIGTGVSTALLDLVAALGALTHAQMTPRFEPARGGDVRFSRGNISKAANLLGYAPKIALAEGLAKTLEFYRSSAPTTPKPLTEG